MDGTAANDLTLDDATISATGFRNSFTGGGGDDTIEAAGGFDFINGDAVIGETLGDDVISAALVGNFIGAGEGDDTVTYLKTCRTARPGRRSLHRPGQ